MLWFASIGTKDMGKAKAFYDTLLGELWAKQTVDIGRLVMWGTGSWAGLAVAEPFNGEEAHPGNGNMAALAVSSNEEVDKMYEKALELGATCEGKPGERIPGFYAAYFRDLDGNKLNFFHMAG